MDFTVPADQILKMKESEMRAEYLNLAREKAVEHESDIDINLSVLKTISKALEKRLEKIRYLRKSGTHPYHRIVKIS